MKYIAITIILASSFMTAFFTVRNNNRHLKMLESTVRFITVTGNIATHGKRSFIQSVIGYNDTENDPLMTFTKIFTDNIDNTSNIPEIWCNTIDAADIMLNKKEKHTLKEFGRNMCSCGEENLSETISLFKKNFNDYIKTTAENNKEKNRISTILIISGGILITLILI